MLLKFCLYESKTSRLSKRKKKKEGARLVQSAHQKSKSYAYNIFQPAVKNYKGMYVNEFMCCSKF